ncbi:hypothetical protein J19TS2_49230 [Cohnella xylanilytica]|uniref:hypothetical protein n=1 Tax=Cohnella xylanilytica TaxID=557555 RepID=UPI001B2A8D38|nr:hypothetical protein [Cohnella xylanilytica]GIO15368.1 hypothetical protein J19TS2_49230 [Cohnella xylanilytica]
MNFIKMDDNSTECPICGSALKSRILNTKWFRLPNQHTNRTTIKVNMAILVCKRCSRHYVDKSLETTRTLDRITYQLPTISLKQEIALTKAIEEERKKYGIKEGNGKRVCEKCDYYNGGRCAIHFIRTSPNDTCKRFKHYYKRVYYGGRMS